MCDVCNIQIGSLKKGSIVYSAADFETVDFTRFIINHGNLQPWANSFYAGNKNTANGYMADGENRILHKITIERDIKIIISNCVCFKNGNWRGVFSKIATALIKERIIYPDFQHRNPDTAPFMQALGEKQYMFRCFANLDGEWENIIPYQLMTQSNFRFQKCVERESTDRTNIDIGISQTLSL